MTTKCEQSGSGSALTADNVHAYFAQINPIAERMAKAIADTKTAYGMLWYTLNTSDQDEIINETLIKPEITLQYIDNLYGKRSSTSSSSLDFSTPGSLTDNVMKDLNQMSITDLKVINKETGTSKESKDMKRIFVNKNNQYYGYDGRTLSSFATQRVAQKLLKDDALAEAGYRDEHSAPFSYRTRSQINFQLNSDLDHNDKEFVLAYNKAKIINDASALAKAAVKKQQENSAKKQKRIAPSKPVVSKNKTDAARNEQKPYKTVAATEMPAYMGYACSPQEDEESSSLIPPPQLRKDSKVLISSSQLSSATLSDEDDHDYYNTDSQHQQEEAKLLDTNVSLKRGFEFLSNW